MSITDLSTAITTIITVITAIAAFVSYMSKNVKDKSILRNVAITASIVTCVMTLSITLIIVTSRPTVAVNHYVTVPLPGKPAQLESSSNTVVVATTTPVPADVTKTVIENRTLACLNSCNSNLKLVLNEVVINTSKGKMTWNFTVTNTGNQGCSASISMYVEDPSGVQYTGAAPGTLTEGTPIGAGQALVEYTTIGLIPKTGVTYAMHTSPSCYPGGSDTDQVETFTF